MPVSKAPQRESGNAKVNTLGGLLPIEIYIARDVVDGAGEKSHHIVFRAVGTRQFFRLLPAGAEASMQQVAGWLNDQIEKAIAKKAPGVQAKAAEPALPPDMGGDV